jgi:hypothetical protein
MTTGSDMRPLDRAPSHRSLIRVVALASAFFLLAAGGGDTLSYLATFAAQGETAAEPELKPVPRAVCAEGDRVETGIQGRVSRADHDSGLAAQGLQCNAELVGQHTQEKAGIDGTIIGNVGGYKVHRYVDDQGNECGYYDTSLLPPTNAPDGNLGVRVLDMNDPKNPKLSMILKTPAMVSPHESLILSETRGLLMAVAGNLSQAVLPGIVDIYDLNGPLGCSIPILQSSTHLGVWGHESGLSPDGNTFYAASFSTTTITALDISDPKLPVTIGTIPAKTHGMSVSDDGTRGYLARNSSSNNGFVILDLTQFQNRDENPVAEQISHLRWEGMTTPQSTVPITVDGHPFVIESDEFGPGASRIIDISNEKEPFIVSNLRLEVHQKDIRAENPSMEDDPGVNTPFQFAQDYTGHFCNVPTRVNPKIVACGMAVSGLRVFNIEDPCEPYEVAYFTAPVQTRVFPEGSNWAYSMPVFAPERNEVWYSEGYTGFYNVKLTNGAWPDEDIDFDANPFVPCHER